MCVNYDMSPSTFCAYFSKENSLLHVVKHAFVRLYLILSIHIRAYDGIFIMGACKSDKAHIGQLLYKLKTVHRRKQGLCVVKTDKEHL